VVEHQGSRRVPEIVEPDHRQTSFPDQDLEIPEQITGVDRTAGLSGKDQPQLLPAVAGFDSFGMLPLIMAPQCFDRLGANRDRPSTKPGFGGQELYPLPSRPDELPLNPKSLT
jgi:hypothetical protein